MTALLQSLQTTSRSPDTPEPDRALGYLASVACGHVVGTRRKNRPRVRSRSQPTLGGSALTLPVAASGICRLWSAPARSAGGGQRAVTGPQLCPAAAAATSLSSLPVPRLVRPSSLHPSHPPPPPPQSTDRALRPRRQPPPPPPPPGAPEQSVISAGSQRNSSAER